MESGNKESFLHTGVSKSGTLFHPSSIHYLTTKQIYLEGQYLPLFCLIKNSTNLPKLFINTMRNVKHKQNVWINWMSCA